MAFISTQDLSALPPIDEFKRLLQSLATLDTILSADDGGYYWFDSRWAQHQHAAGMSNGSGDDFFVYFNRHGCLLKGFAHESQMSPYRVSPPQLWPGLLDDIPKQFDTALKEPAFMMQDTTFAIWRLHTDNKWHCGNVEFSDDHYGDGSEEMLSILDGHPESYVSWASEYYETEVDAEAVRHVYVQQPITDELVKSLNPATSMGKLHNCFVKIGYPGF